MRLLVSAGIAGVLALGAAAPVFAQAGCATLCAVPCAKPLSIPDRWDDATGIPGYMGEGSKRPNWRNNGAFDSEAFFDQNGNGLWDSGETYVDGNGNGAYDRELYDPATTGYSPVPNALSPGGDLGMALLLSFGVPGTPPGPGQYLPIDFPAVNKGTPETGGDPYRDAWASCTPSTVGPGDRVQVEASSMSGPTNQAMRDLIAQDPDAYWDPGTQSVQGSHYAQSPRVIFLPVHDPRFPITSGTSTVLVTKVVAFFLEEMVGNASVNGRLMRAMASGETCPGDGFLVECPTPAQTTSWGRVKDLYR